MKKGPSTNQVQLDNLVYHATVCMDTRPIMSVHEEEAFVTDQEL